MARDDALEKRLQRLQHAISRKEAKPRSSKSPYSLLAIGVAFIAAAIATGNQGLMIPGFILAILGAARGLGLALRGSRDSSKPSIGMGAEVHPGATVEAGAVVEMGAEVHPGAVVRSGAIVRMGAEVRESAVIEAGAVVGWGADVEAGAVVEEGAVVGAGATVRKGARVPRGTHIAAGATYASGAASVAAPPQPVDERRKRIDDSCTRIEAELKQLPETFREHLGTTSETAASLRSTCLELLDRERTVRAEASDEGLKFLDAERDELAKRVAGATDAAVKRSLESALFAIDDQKKHRLQLKTYADRLDAEVTRLQYTLEGMSAQLVRLRSAGLDASQPPSGEVMKSVQQLHEEIDAIAEALEHVSMTDAARMQPISEVSSERAAPQGGTDRVR